MSRSKKTEDDYDDFEPLCDDDVHLELFFDVMEEQSIARRRKTKKYRTQQRLYDIQEKRWLRRQVNDWDADWTH